MVTEEALEFSDRSGGATGMLEFLPAPPEVPVWDFVLENACRAAARAAGPNRSPSPNAMSPMRSRPSC